MSIYFSFTLLIHLELTDLSVIYLFPPEVRQQPSLQMLVAFMVDRTQDGPVVAVNYSVKDTCNLITQVIVPNYLHGPAVGCYADPLGVSSYSYGERVTTFLNDG